MSYHSPRGLYPFQGVFAAYGVLRPANLVVADTGLGKTHIALATLSILFDDDQIDRAIIVVEANKIGEWLEDIATFTDLRAVKLHGTRRAIADDAQVVVTTYATFKLDFQDRLAADARTIWPSLLCTEQPLRMMVVYDETAYIGTSVTSQMYRAHKATLDYWRGRDGGSVRAMGLTATPMTTSPVNYYIIGTLLAPELVGESHTWFARYVSSYDDRSGQPRHFQHLDEWADTIGQLILRKRKTDPDVIDKFPALVERFTTVELSKAHRRAYDSLEAYIKALPFHQQVIAFRALLAFACHPHSVLASESDNLQGFVTEYGAEKIRRLHSSKSQAVIPYLGEILGQGDAGVLVFCQSVNALNGLSQDLTDAGIEHLMYHGGLSSSQRDAVKARFRTGAVRVMLCSSAGERGINLPEAHYVVNYDVPPLHSSYIQRLNRASRIDARSGGVLVVKTFMAAGTIDHGAFRLWMRRNEWSDLMQDRDTDDDGEFITSHDRWLMMAQAARFTADEVGS